VVGYEAWNPETKNSIILLPQELASFRKVVEAIPAVGYSLENMTNAQHTGANATAGLHDNSDYLSGLWDAAGQYLSDPNTLIGIAGAGLGAAAAGRVLRLDASKGTGRYLPFIDADRLAEVNKTLDRIESAGPFPYKKDGTMFKNKENRLPEGNFREYTVDTPEANNRGARRIVQDIDTGKTYYTDDHYNNFIMIDPEKK